ncbi:MAG: vanadium-dependent haloperoxidase [Bacteroidetes bacterium]|nr:vanadium-dependent haloperoxidase [Bacteroidota bacterium]
MKRFLYYTAIASSVLFLIVFQACKSGNKEYQTKAQNPEFIHKGVRRLTDIIRHDIFAPPISARIYAYSSIAAYEALVPGYPEYQSLAGQLNGLQPGPQPEAGKEYCYPLASVNAMLTMGKQLVFSEGDVEDLEETLFQEFANMNMPQDVYDRSMAYGDAVAKHILAWSKKDNYAQTRSMPKFTIQSELPSRWIPTPPAYADALEPHWSKIRPWVIDSANQFLCAAAIPFSDKKDSEFYKEALEIHDIVKNLTPWQDSTAWYWDDNPFKLEVSGHFMFGRKKISPGGHWMNIASHANRKAGSDIMKSTETYVKVACALADGFIACWNAKYRYNLIRPESYINKYMDPDWRPLIQTPPFPEHPSGHSTISGAAAAALTSMYGENFAFSDSTEMEFGIPPRTFKSFEEAANQAGMSRMYGGIHFRNGNLSGLKTGGEIGRYIAQKLHTRK